MGQLHHWFWSTSTGGVQATSWGSDAAGDPSAFITADNQQHVFARSSGNHLYHWYWSPGMDNPITQDWGGQL